MHGKDRCHGDVRAANIVFNGSESRLIDHDLSGCTGGRYSEAYRFQIPDGGRAKGARFVEDALLTPTNGLLHPSHDLYALASVMGLHSCPTATQPWEDAMLAVSGGGEDALSALRAIAGAALAFKDPDLLKQLQWCWLPSW
eukprot:m.195819 g.195819  ORF g.195819 m.195819 type:complete len:141 (-) comp10082_c0_seq3:161-583(-)